MFAFAFLEHQDTVTETVSSLGELKILKKSFESSLLLYSLFSPFSPQMRSLRIHPKKKVKTSVCS